MAGLGWAKSLHLTSAGLVCLYVNDTKWVCGARKERIGMSVYVKGFLSFFVSVSSSVLSLLQERGYRFSFQHRHTYIRRIEKMSNSPYVHKLSDVEAQGELLANSTPSASPLPSPNPFLDVSTTPFDDEEEEKD